VLPLAITIQEMPLLICLIHAPVPLSLALVQILLTSSNQIKGQFVKIASGVLVEYVLFLLGPMVQIHPILHLDMELVSLIQVGVLESSL